MTPGGGGNASSGALNIHLASRWFTPLHGGFAVIFFFSPFGTQSEERRVTLADAGPHLPGAAGFPTEGSRRSASLSLPDADIPDSIGGSLQPRDNASAKHYNQQAGEVTASARITTAEKCLPLAISVSAALTSSPALHLHLALSQLPCLSLFISLFQLHLCNLQVCTQEKESLSIRQRKERRWWWGGGGRGGGEGGSNKITEHGEESHFPPAIPSLGRIIAGIPELG